MNPYQISQDPIWHRWVDGLVILIIGVAAGLVIAQGMMIEEVTTTTETRRTITAPQVDPDAASTDVPSGVRVEEG